MLVRSLPARAGREPAERRPDAEPGVEVAECAWLWEAEADEPISSPDVGGLRRLIEVDREGRGDDEAGVGSPLLEPEAAGRREELPRRSA